MHGFWSFDVPLATKHQRLAVFFCSLAAPTDEDLRHCIERHCETTPPPERVLLIAPRSEQDALLSSLELPIFKDHLASVTRYRNTPDVDLLLFDETGRLFDSSGIPKDTPELGRIRRIGLTSLAQKALLPANPWSHFEIPSRRHAQRFIRLGNVMVDGGAIDYMAFCCLPFVSPDLKYIYCDTGTISPVAYALNNMRLRIAPGIRPLAVDSFGSYEGAKTFRFREPDHAIILISVTSSGGLAPHICKLDANVPPSSIVVVFGLCDLPGYRVVCDLRKHDRDNPDGFDTFTSYDPTNCPMCRRQLSVIRISGEQLLPGPPQVNEIMLRATDAPNWLWRFLRATVGKTFIHANYQSPGTRHASKDIYVDLEGLFESQAMLGLDDYQNRLRWIIDQAVPAHTRRMICLDSPASFAMARTIREILGERFRDLEIIRYSDVVTQLGERNMVMDTGSTLVVAAAVASGRSIMAVAQLLRHIQKNAAINYVVGIARTPDREASQEIRGNVTFGERPGDHGYYLLDEVYLPLLSSQARTSWDYEVDLLNGLAAVCGEEPLRLTVEARIGAINQGASEVRRGLIDNLFWPRVDDVELKLRRGFVFFDFDHREATSQADVFFTVTAVLHSMRRVRDLDGPLFQHEQTRKILSPLCFDRFNDGIIQAALLRAALPVELDYSVSEELSRQMAMFLECILGNAANEAGEAAREFLLAMALERLRLREHDTQDLRMRFSESMSDPVCRLLWTKISTSP